MSLLFDFFFRPRVFLNTLCDRLIDCLWFRRSLGGTYASVVPGGYATESISYSELMYIFRRVDINKDDVLVDVGCGLGRVIGWWLRHNKTKNNAIFGLEANPVIARKAKQAFQKNSNVTILEGDACETLPANATIIYCYSPFNAIKMAEFKSKVNALRFDPTIVYYYTVHLDCFLNDENWDVKIYEISNYIWGKPKSVLAIIKRNEALKIATH